MADAWHRWTWRLSCVAGCLGVSFSLAAGALPSAASAVSTSYPDQPGQLSAVSASSPDNVWAVGSGATRSNTSIGSLLLRWDGHRWRRVPSPDPGARYITTMSAVRAFSRSDVWAVGSYYNPSTSFSRGLILHWNGRTVREVPGPRGLQLRGVVALGGISPDNLWALANVGSGLSLLHWTGRAWTVRYSRACGDALWFASRTAGWAVGAFGVGQDSGTRTCIRRWNGQQWAKVPSPDPGGTSAYNNLLSVSGTSASDAWAVGGSTNGTLGLHWNGTSWRKARMPPFAGPAPGGLDGVSALTRTDAWAVGSYSPVFAEKTLTLHWNGRKWSRITSPNHAGPHGTRLNAVAAVSPGDVWAVGNYGANGGVPRTWITHWNGRAWKS